jgi:hypothetical protein
MVKLRKAMEEATDPEIREWNRRVYKKLMGELERQIDDIPRVKAEGERKRALLLVGVWIVTFVVVLITFGLAIQKQRTYTWATIWSVASPVVLYCATEIWEKFWDKKT